VGGVLVMAKKTIEEHSFIDAAGVYDKRLAEKLINDKKIITEHGFINRLRAYDKKLAEKLGSVDASIDKIEQEVL